MVRDLKYKLSCCVAKGRTFAPLSATAWTWEGEGVSEGHVAPSSLSLSSLTPVESKKLGVKLGFGKCSQVKGFIKERLE